MKLPEFAQFKLFKLMVILISILLVININTIDFSNQTVQAAPPPPDDDINGTQYIDDDWDVYGKMNYTDEIIDLSGNLTIHPGAVLTFRNVTLRMNVTEFSPLYHIEILEGGTFYILDGDEDPKTTFDASNITDSIFDNDNLLADESDYRYAFKVRPEGYLEIRNSQIREIGSMWHKDWEEWGIFYEAKNLVVRNSTFSNLYWTFDINRRGKDDTVGNMIFDNNTFYNIKEGIYLYDFVNFEIKNCLFYKFSQRSLYISRSKEVRILNTTFYYHTSPKVEVIRFTNSENVRISGCVFDQITQKSLYVYSTENILIENCSFTNSTNYAIYFSSGVNQPGQKIYIKYNYFNNVNNPMKINAYNSIQILNNVINNTNGYVIDIETSSDIQIKNNIINNSQNNNFAIDVYQSDRVKIQNNIIFETYSGIYLGTCYEGNVITKNVITGRGSFISAHGIHLWNTDDIIMMNNLIGLFTNGIYAKSATQNNPDNPVRIYFGSILFCNKHVYVETSPSNINMYNVSFDPTRIVIDQSSSNVNVYFTVHVLVLDSEGPVGAAEVTAVDTKTKTHEFRGNTISNGWAYNIFVLNGTYDDSGPMFHSPYNFSANVSGVIAYASKNYTIDSFIKIKISYTINTPPGPPVNLRYELNYTNIDIYWECYITDLLWYKVFQNDSSGGWKEISNVTSPPGGLTKKYVEVDNATDMVYYRYKIHHIDLAYQEGVNEIVVLFNDWVITDNRMIENSKPVHDGNIYILDGGEFELINVSLTMNGTFGMPEIKMIEVQNNGRLIITDGDDDNTTTDDMSVINASSKMEIYHFIVQGGGALEIYNSRIQNASYVLDEDAGRTAAIYINDGECEIHNSTIISPNTNTLPDYIIYMDSAYDSTIYGTHFDNNGSGRYYNGLYIYDSINITIENNSFNQSKNYEVEVEESENIDIINNTMYCYSFAMTLNNSNHVYIYNNLINNTGMKGAGGGKGGGSLSSAAISSRLTENLTVESNVIEDFISAGMYIEQCDRAEIVSNVIRDSPNVFFAVYASRSNDILIFQNEVYNFTGSYLAGGIVCEYFDKLTIGFNEISFMTAPGGFGIALGNEDQTIVEGDVLIYNNTMHHLDFDSLKEGDYGGIYLWEGDNYYIFNNTIYEAGRGLFINAHDYSSIWNNTIYNVTEGVYQTGGKDLFYFGNVQTNVDYGYYFFWGCTATIQNCSISGTPIFTVYVNESCEITLINPYFNLSKLYVTDQKCRIHIYWLFDLLVKDQFGLPQKDIFVRLRNVYGTILGESLTDSSGMVKNIFLKTRTQFFDGNATNNPHKFQAQLGNHDGELQIAVASGATIQMQLDNEAPSAYNIEVKGTINPLIPRTKDDLTLSYVFSDPELDANSGTIIKWYKNGVYQPALDNLTTVNSLYTSKNDLWYCTVTPSDGADYGYTSTSMTAHIYNTKPRVTDIIIGPTGADSLQDLSVQYTFEDNDGDDELGTLFRWYLVEGSTHTLKATTNEPMLNYSKTLKGEKWRVSIEPKDGESAGDEHFSDNLTIGNTRPTIENAFINPTEPCTEDSLYVQYTFKDVDGDSEGATLYRWYKVPAGGQNFVMAGYNESSVPPEALTKGERWRCQIVPHDGTQYGFSVNSTEVIIDNSAPEIIDVKTLPSSPTTDYELWVEYEFTDRDNDYENDSRYEWFEKTGDIFISSDWKLPRLPSIFTQKSDVWICKITPFDGFTLGETKSSPEVKINNSAPSVSNLLISPDRPKTSDTLLAIYEYYDNNNDPEDGTTIYWYRNGVHQSQLDNEKSVDSSHTQKNDTWYFSVIPKDGYITGRQVNSPEIKIINTPPEIRLPRITNLFPRGDDDLDITYTYYDPDGDESQEIYIRWYMNDILQSDFNDEETIPANATEKDQSWYYKISAFDGTDTSAENISFPVKIRNAPPVIIKYYPPEDEITMNETENMEFRVEVMDMDDDVIFYQWVLEDQNTLDTKPLGEDYFLNFQTDYDDAGTYILNVSIQDWGVGSFKIYHEWKVIVLNNNRLPTLGEYDPEDTDPGVREDKSLKFSITYSDPDDEDTLTVTWYFDNTEAAKESDTYTYYPSGYSAGKHTVTAVIYDGYDNTSKTWNVSVKDIDEDADLIYGLTWDQWSVIIQVIVILVTAIVAVFGFFRLRKKKGALHNYLKQIEAPMKTWQEDPVKAEEQLMDVADLIEKDYKARLIEDLHYFLLDRQLKENLREIRQEQVGRSFSYLPADTLKEIEVMLEDGKITDEEYQTFLEVLGQSDELSPQEKERVKAQMQHWRTMDEKRIDKKPVIPDADKSRKIEWE
jgi:parallel beta-helix repeat protein